MERQSRGKKKHIFTKDVVGLLLGEVVSTREKIHRRKGCGWLAFRRGSKSPYRSGAPSHLRKKNMAGKLFFVFAKIRIPLVCTYVYCTKWNRNISLIHVKVR